MSENLVQYGTSFQSKIITSLMLDNKFTKQIVDILEVSYFDTDSTKYLIKNIKDYFEKYKTPPTMEAIKVIIDGVDNPTLKNVKVESTKNIDSNILTKFSAKAFDGDKIVFYELKPDYQFESLQTVFIIPGSGNQGAVDVLGLDNEYKDYFYHKNIGKKLVNEGYVVYVIENRGWGERTIDAGLHCNEPNVYCSGNVLSKHTVSTYFLAVILSNAFTTIVLFSNIFSVNSIS